MEHRRQYLKIPEYGTTEKCLRIFTFPCTIIHGTLYVCDSRKGRIWRIWYNK